MSQQPAPGHGQATTGASQGGEMQEAAGSRQPGLTLDEALTGDMRLALHDFVQSATVCEWCADQCIDEGVHMANCIRLCRDVADLAMQNVRFMARDSSFGPDLAEAFMVAAEECARECGKHQHAHCQDCASVLRRAIDSTRGLLETLDQPEQPGGQVEPQATPQY